MILRFTWFFLGALCASVVEFRCEMGPSLVPLRLDGSIEFQFPVEFNFYLLKERELILKKCFVC